MERAFPIELSRSLGADGSRLQGVVCFEVAFKNVRIGGQSGVHGAFQHRHDKAAHAPSRVSLFSVFFFFLEKLLLITIMTELSPQLEVFLGVRHALSLNSKLLSDTVLVAYGK